MKKLLLSLMILSSASFANTVAVWNSELAIANTTFAKDKIVTTQNAIQPKQQQIKTYQANIESLQQQYRTADDSQKAEIAKQIESNVKNYEQVSAQIQQTLTINQKEIFNKINPQLKTIMQNLMKQKNIDVLIDDATGAVSFVKPEFDITNDVTNALNQQVK
ncbi:OmpH family outer membrane protein [Faucicola boevrei]|uniref:OmpH family outer membrane protein n=1 Tax=Faucicola boevrei TaxID=346665 RepID=UPI000360A55F|nr:OmpH family outer membrane protein [Moraxella boevrei]